MLPKHRGGGIKLCFKKKQKKQTFNGCLVVYLYPKTQQIVMVERDVYYMEATELRSNRLHESFISSTIPIFARVDSVFIYLYLQESIQYSFIYL